MTELVVPADVVVVAEVSGSVVVVLGNVCVVVVGMVVVV